MTIETDPRTLIKKLHDDMQRNEARPAVDEICARLLEIDAMIVAQQSRTDTSTKKPSTKKR